MTRRATLETTNLDLSLLAEDCIFKLDRQIEPQIFSAPLTALSLLAAAHVEHLAEQVAEDVAQVHCARKTAKAARPASSDTRMPKTIIRSPLVGVAQHLVGLARFLELLLGGMIAGVPVWMILQCLLAIGALQLLVVRITRNTQDLVIVSFAH